MITSIEQWLQNGDFFTYREFKIFYKQFGKGDDLIIVHGYPFSSYEWKALIPKLSSSFRVTVFDLLGFGFSDKPVNHNYSFSEYSNILISLALHLKIKETHIISHDLGVGVIQELLAKKNDFGMPIKIKTICFANGNLFSDAYKPRLIQRILSQSPSFIGRIVSKRISKKSVFNAISNLHGCYTKPESNYFNELWEILHYNNGKNISYLLGRLVFEKAKYQQRWLNAMNNSNIPMCYLCGPADPNSGIYMALSFQKKFPGQSILWMPDHIGHWPMAEDPVTFSKLYFDWLNKQGYRKLQIRVGKILKKKVMKKMQKITGLFLFVCFTSIFMLSCSSDNDGGNSSGERRVTFKVVGSSGANITTVVYALGSTTFPVTEINSSSWTSEEILLPANTNTVSLAGNAIGTSASSSIRLQIFVNGEMKKEVSQSGTVMSTYTQYVF